METYVLEVSETLIGGDNLTLHSVEYAGPDKNAALEKAREYLEKIKRRDNCLHYYVRIYIWKDGKKIGMITQSDIAEGGENDVTSA